MVLDVLKPLQHKKILEHELEGFGIRLNKEPPNISFRRKDKGGINLTATVSSMLVHLPEVMIMIDLVDLTASSSTLFVG
jgi:ribosome-interacting GTPase 1